MSNCVLHKTTYVIIYAVHTIPQLHCDILTADNVDLLLSYVGQKMATTNSHHMDLIQVGSTLMFRVQNVTSYNCCHVFQMETWNWCIHSSDQFLGHTLSWHHSYIWCCCCYSHRIHKTYAAIAVHISYPWLFRSVAAKKYKYAYAIILLDWKRWFSDHFQVVIWQMKPILGFARIQKHQNNVVLLLCLGWITIKFIQFIFFIIKLCRKMLYIINRIV